MWLRSRDSTLFCFAAIDAEAHTMALQRGAHRLTRGDVVPHCSRLHLGFRDPHLDHVTDAGGNEMNVASADRGRFWLLGP